MVLTAIKCNRRARAVDSDVATWESSARTMRWGDVRCAWVLLVLAAACERRAAPRRYAARTEPPARVTTAPAAVVPVAGCAAGWWPLAPGQRWRWRLERTWTDADTGALHRRAEVREVSVRDAGVRGGVRRYAITGWPAPWTDAMTAELAVEVDGTTVRRGTIDAPTLAPWFGLTDDGEDHRRLGVDRALHPAQADRPAELELVWRSLADDLTLRLACGVGPVELAYHHHGTVEELRAVRLAATPSP